MRDELGGIVGPVDDVDLLAVKLVHDGAHPLPHRPDAGALRVNARDCRADCDFRAMAGLARDGTDHDRAVGDLGHLEREKLLDQVGVRSGKHYLRPADALADADHDALDPCSVLVALARDPLSGGKQRFEPTEVDHHVLRVPPLLDDSRDDVTLGSRELTELSLILSVAEPLKNDLLGGGRCDPAEACRGVVVLRDRVAFFIGFGCVDRDVAGLAVKLAPRLRLGAGTLVVGREQCLLDGVDQYIEGDFLLAFERTQDRHINIHAAQLSFRLNSISMRALATSSYPTSRFSPSTSNVTP